MSANKNFKINENIKNKDSDYNNSFLQNQHNKTVLNPNNLYSNNSINNNPSTYYSNSNNNKNNTNNNSDYNSYNNNNNNNYTSSNNSIYIQNQNLTNHLNNNKNNFYSIDKINNSILELNNNNTNTNNNFINSNTNQSINYYTNSYYNPTYNKSRGKRCSFDEDINYLTISTSSFNSSNNNNNTLETVSSGDNKKLKIEPVIDSNNSSISYDYLSSYHSNNSKGSPIDSSSILPSSNKYYSFDSVEKIQNNTNSYRSNINNTKATAIATANSITSNNNTTNNDLNKNSNNNINSSNNINRNNQNSYLPNTNLISNNNHTQLSLTYYNNRSISNINYPNNFDNNNNNSSSNNNNNNKASLKLNTQITPQIKQKIPIYSNSFFNYNSSTMAPTPILNNESGGVKMDYSSTNDTIHYNMKRKSLSKMSIDNLTNIEEDYQKETKKLNSSDTYISTNTNNNNSSNNNNSTSTNTNNSLNHISQSTTPYTTSINNLNNHSDNNINTNTTNATTTTTITTNNNDVNKQSNNTNNSNIIPQNSTMEVETEKNEIPPSTNRIISNNNSDLTTKLNKSTLSIPKAKNNTNNCIYLPKNFYEVDINHLIYLIAEMLEKLTKYNDQITLTKENLTRFHSRKAPEISIYDYLKRIVKYAAIDKVALLSLLIYIDRICKRHRLFTISSLTVHRFIITSLTCASKAMCDSICTNLHYSKVGGIHIKELNLLELEFLFLIDWNLACTDVSELQQYYVNLVRQSSIYHIMPEPEEEINSKSLNSEDNQNDNNYSKGLHDVD